MIVTLENGNQVRGDLIKSAVVRSDLSPIPLTLEAEIRSDEDMVRMLSEGKTLSVNQDVFKIISLPADGKARITQGKHGIEYTKLVAILEKCHTTAFVRNKAIIKIKSTLSEIYKSSGATFSGIDSDITIPYFSCLAGSYPTAPIAQVLQEQGGVVRWKKGKMDFFRLPTLFDQTPIMTIPDIADENISSGFLEHHEIPTFYSINDKGEFIYGNRAKARTAIYVPNKNEQQLVNMSRCLVHRKVIPRMALSPAVSAGDLIGIMGKKPLVIITAAHAFFGGSDGAGSDAYTRLWLGGLSS